MVWSTFSRNEESSERDVVSYWGTKGDERRLRGGVVRLVASFLDRIGLDRIILTFGGCVKRTGGGRYLIVLCCITDSLD